MPLYRNFVDFVSNQVIGGIKNFTQNLGLGISTPQAKIHIDGGDNTASNIKFTAGTTTGQSVTDGFDIGITSSGNAEIRQRELSNIDFFTNDVLSARIGSNAVTTFYSTISSTSSTTGAVTIGGGLGISENINAGGTILAPTLSSTTNIITPLIRRTGTSGTNAAGLSITLQSGAGTGTGALSSILFNTADSGASGTASQNITEKMRLSGAGNLLIGTSTDNGNDRLQVAGSANFTNNLSISGNTNTAFTHTGAAAIGSSSLFSFVQLGVLVGSNTRTGLVIRGQASQTANLQSWQNSAGTVLSSVAADGIITAPQFRLSANSTAPASPTDTGVLGETRWTQDFIYYCYATNNWSRFAKDNTWS